MTDSAGTPADAAFAPACTSPDIVVARRRAAGIVRLARPETGNLLTVGMRQVLAQSFPDFARDPIIYAVVIRSCREGAFSAGTDLREIAALYRADPETARRAIGNALELCWLQECFSKPTVSLMDGMTAGGGGGGGISAYGTHRVAGENYVFACPETDLGLVPSAGMSHVLARMPNATGVYLALTGQPIRRADAYRLGLVTHCIGRSGFEEIEDRLSDADPVDQMLDPLHVDPGLGHLAVLEPLIARCFSAGSVEEIVMRLQLETGEHAQWCRQTVARLRQGSPLALGATLRLLREARHLDLRDTLLLEHRLVCRLIATDKVLETIAPTGQRADAAQAARLPDVIDHTVASLFAPDAAAGFSLPAREDMQGRRF